MTEPQTDATAEIRAEMEKPGPHHFTRAAVSARLTAVCTHTPAGYYLRVLADADGTRPHVIGTYPWLAWSAADAWRHLADAGYVPTMEAWADPARDRGWSPVPDCPGAWTTPVAAA